MNVLILMHQISYDMSDLMCFTSFFDIEMISDDSLINERIQTLQNISDEFGILGKETNQSVEAEMLMINQQSEFFKNVKEINSLVEKISEKIKKRKNDAENKIIKYEIAYSELLDEQTSLNSELKNAKAMSKSIQNKASDIRSQRISPLLKLICFMSEKSANSQELSDYDDFVRMLFKIVIESSEYSDKNILKYTLGCLVNISATNQGRIAIIDALHNSCLSIFKVIFEQPAILIDPILKKYSIFFISNVILDDEISIELIHDGCIKFCKEIIEQNIKINKESRDENETLFQIINTLVDRKYIKTLEYYAEKELNDIYNILKEEMEYDNLRIKIKSLIDIKEEENSTPARPRWFGIKRIYS